MGVREESRGIWGIARRLGEVSGGDDREQQQDEAGRAVEEIGGRPVRILPK